MKSSLEAISVRLVPWQIRHRRLVISIAAVLSLLGVVGSVLLYSDLRSGIEELLPESAASVIAARVVGPKMRPSGQLSIVLDGANPDAMDRFADDLVKRLHTLPPEFVDQIQYRNDDQESFIRKFGLLYLDTPDLKTIRDRVAARVAWERQHSNPLMLIVDEDEPAPSVDFSDIEGKYSALQGATVDFRKGYYQTPEGNLLVINVRPPASSTGAEFNGRLLSAVKHEVESLQPALYDPKMKVGYTGEVAELVEEQLALVADLTASTIIVFVLVIAALWLYYRRWGAIAAVFGPLLVGCAITFGLAYLMIGHLNANTAFLGSIVIGNGINVGIIFVARYLEERRRLVDVDEAIRTTWVNTIPATFVAAFGSALAYLSLAATDFRGFSQFGAVGFVGMTLCWLGVYLLMPSMLSAIEAWRPISAGRAHRPGEGLGHLTSWVERYPVVFRVISIVLVIGCLASIASYSGDVIEYDMTRIRSKSSLKSGTVFWAKKVDSVFRSYLTPLVIWADSPADLDKIVAKLNTDRQQLGAQDPIREVRTLQGAIPSDQAEKLAIVSEIRGLLPPNRMKKMPADLRAKVQKLIPDTEPRAMTLQDLPDLFRRALIEKDGTTGRLALLFPRKVGGLDLHDARFMKELMRRAITESGVKGQAVSPLFLLSDIDDAIWHDGPEATLIAFVLVCLLVILILRQFGPSALVIFSLMIGLLGLVGLAATVNTRVNFLNFVVLPITFGIGVDYAINIIQRYRVEGAEALGRILQETGGAVALCSATTVIGYGSLIVADSQALSGFGLLAAIGELTCLSTALFLLPAWLFPRKPLPEVDVSAATGS